MRNRFDLAVLGHAVGKLAYDETDRTPVRVIARLSREHAGYSQPKMAELFGVSRWTIIRIEAGRHRFPPETAEKWAELCGIPYGWIEQEVNW